MICWQPGMFLVSMHFRITSCGVFAVPVITWGVCWLAKLSLHSSNGFKKILDINALDTKNLVVDLSSCVYALSRNKCSEWFIAGCMIQQHSSSEYGIFFFCSLHLVFCCSYYFTDNSLCKALQLLWNIYYWFLWISKLKLQNSA